MIKGQKPNSTYSQMNDDSGAIPVYGPISANGSLDFLLIPDPKNKTGYWGTSVFAGMSASWGENASAGFHAGTGGTITIFSINVYDIYDTIYNKYIGG